MTIPAELKAKGIDVLIDFVESISMRNISKTHSLLSDDTTVITYQGLIIEGKYAALEYWQNKLNNDPGYLIEIDEATVRGKKIVLTGIEERSSSEAINAIWEASVENGKITCWRKYFSSDN